MFVFLPPHLVTLREYLYLRFREPDTAPPIIEISPCLNGISSKFKENLVTPTSICLRRRELYRSLDFFLWPPCNLCSTLAVFSSLLLILFSKDKGEEIRYDALLVFVRLDFIRGMSEMLIISCP